MDKYEYEILKLNETLNKFSYGTYENNKIIDIHPKFHTLPLSSVLTYKVGCCWELTLLAATYFSTFLPQIKYKLYYYQTEKYETHTWLAYEYNNEFIIFESAWKQYQGLYSYKNEKRMLKDYSKKLYNSNDYKNTDWFICTWTKFIANRLNVCEFMGILLHNSSFVIGNRKIYVNTRNLSLTTQPVKMFL